MTFDSINLTWLIAGSAAAASCWRQIAGLASRFRSMLVVRATLSGHVATAAVRYCQTTFKRSPFGDRAFHSDNFYVRPLKRMAEVAFEKLPVQPLIYWNGWRPILLVGFAGTGDNRGVQTHSDIATLVTVRLGFDLDKLVTDALSAHNHQRHGGTSRFRVQHVVGRGARMMIENNSTQAHYSGGGLPSPIQQDPRFMGARILGWNDSDLGQPTTRSALDNLALGPACMEIVHEFKRWRMSEEWYRERAITWRRGVLLYGPPGTGKTILVSAMAQSEDLPVFSFNLASLSNEEMMREWRQMKQDSPCVALIEDVDAVFRGRENIVGEAGGGLTFDCLLNCLGGIDVAEGVFIIVTTNHMEHIDPALGRADEGGQSTRPGRLDRVFKVPLLGPDQRRKIAQRILGEWPEEIEAVLDGDETAARLTERCIRVALKRKWEEQDPYQSAEYQQFVESMVPHCHCHGQYRPCDGVLAGGMCDGSEDDREDGE